MDCGWELHGFIRLQIIFLGHDLDGWGKASVEDNGTAKGEAILLARSSWQIVDG